MNIANIDSDFFTNNSEKIIEILKNWTQNIILVYKVSKLRSKVKLYNLDVII